MIILIKNFNTVNIGYKSESPGTGLIGGSKSPDVGSCNQTWH